METSEILNKVVDRLKSCIQDCEEAYDELIDCSEITYQIFEGRQELAQNLLEFIESAGVIDETD